MKNFFKMFSIAILVLLIFNVASVKGFSKEEAENSFKSKIAMDKVYKKDSETGEYLPCYIPNVNFYLQLSENGEDLLDFRGNKVEERILDTKLSNSSYLTKNYKMDIDEAEHTLKEYINDIFGQDYYGRFFKEGEEEYTIDITSLKSRFYNNYGNGTMTIDSYGKIKRVKMQPLQKENEITLEEGYEKAIGFLKKYYGEELNELNFQNRYINERKGVIHLQFNTKKDEGIVLDSFITIILDVYTGNIIEVNNCLKRDIKIRGNYYYGEAGAKNILLSHCEAVKGNKGYYLKNPEGVMGVNAYTGEVIKAGEF